MDPALDAPTDVTIPEIGQRRILEMIAGGAALSDTLDFLLRLIEAQSPEMLCSVLLLDADGRHLRHGAAPQLADDYVRAIDGVAIGPTVGSCGTSVWRREAVFVADIATDPLWAAYRALALRHDLRACWSTPIFDSAGSVLGTFAVYYRRPGLPTERHLRLIQIATHMAAICIRSDRAEQALRASEARARTLADNSPFGIFMCDPGGRNVYTNRAIHEQFEVPLNEQFGERWIERIHPEDRVRVKAAWQDYVAQGDAARDLEVRIVRRDGAERVVHVSAAPVWESGRLIGHVGNSVDITERKLTEQRLRERESRLRTIIEIDPECLKIVGLDGSLLEVNPAGLAMLEARSLDEAKSQPLIEFVVPEHRDAYHALARQAFAGKNGILEFEIVGLRGTRRWLETHVTPMRDETGKITSLLCLTRDITQRKRAEATLLESETRFRQVVENIHEVFWMIEAESGRVLYVSRLCEEILGVPCDVLYRSPLAWLEVVHPEDRPRIEAASAKLTAGGYDESYRIVRPDGTVRWVRSRGYPVHDNAGRPYRVAGTVEDITERKRLEGELLRANRVESVGRLANGIAHDMNNILAPIVMGASLLRMGTKTPENDKIIAAMETNAKRGADLVRQLLLFSRGLDVDRGVANPAGLIAEIAGMARETFPRQIEIQTSVPAEIWMVHGDTTQLHQVLLNLCLNARDAMPDGGLLRLSAENVELDARDVTANPEAKPGPYVKIRVADTGIGIPPEIAEKVFDPFFTTKGIGKGTGLGLSTVLGIVTSHAGIVQLRSERTGAVFDIFLPAVPRVPRTPVSPAPAAAAGGNGETILVVDDEENIREILAQVLRQARYRVLLAADGAEAATIFAREAAAVRLVITDLDMPIMDGVNLARVVRKINAATPIMIMSGLSGETARPGRTAELAELGIRSMLLKPYTTERVLAAVRTALGDAARRD